MNRICTERYKIRTYELDARQRLTLPSVCSILQDAAGHNAWASGYAVSQLLERGLTWVLSRLLVRMESYPGWNRELVVQTWPSGFSRFFALRDWRLFEGERQVGAAASAWLLVDTESRRPVHPETLLDWRAILHEEKALPMQLGKLPELAAACWKQEFRVRYADLDMNLHANASSYFVWLQEPVGPEIREACEPRQIEVNFLAEVGRGDRVLSRASPLEPGPQDPPEGSERLVMHSLVRASDGRELARARSVWARLS